MKNTERNQQKQEQAEREQIERLVHEVEAADFNYLGKKHLDLYLRFREKVKQLFWT